IAQVEEVVREQIGDDLEMVVSELGVMSDWSAAYTPNAGPMDAVVKVQLKKDRHRSAQQYSQLLRTAFTRNETVFSDLEFSFDTGGLIRSAINEGKSTPLNVRITGKNLVKAHQVAEVIEKDVRRVPGVVDCRIIQRLNYPQYVMNVDRAKATELGLTQT